MEPSLLPHLLVIDDDTRIRQLLKRYLEEHGFFVSTAKDASEGTALLGYIQYDLLIVDVMMPGESGVEFTKRIRSHLTVPVLMLTAMVEAEDRISGLESGADDYLAKPFEPRELLLRIERILQRTRKEPEVVMSSLTRLGTLQFDKIKGNLTGPNGDIPITAAEAKLLSILLNHQGKVVSRTTLAELCGGVNERSIDVQIIRLRGKIEADPKKPAMLKTVRGKGYVLHV